MGLLPVLIAIKSNHFLTLIIIRANRSFLLFTEGLTLLDIMINLYAIQKISSVVDKMSTCRHILPQLKKSSNRKTQGLFSFLSFFINTAVDDFFKGNVQLINNFMMALAEQQIKAAFEQSEKEVTDLHSRISQGMREAKKNGAQIGLSKGTTLTTQKSIECRAIIQKHSKDFGGTLEDPDVIKLCGCSRNSYYKYKREIKS